MVGGISRTSGQADVAEGNKIRTFFRVVFCTCIIISGVDGLTDKKVINMNQ